jgi:ribosomal protein S8
MSLVNLAHVCSHLKNASMARLGLTSIPSTNLHLSLALALQKQGFLSSVSRGGPTGPDPPSTPPEPVTQSNISSRRLWVGLKYWNNEPVIKDIKLLSKPTQRIWVKVEDLEAIIRGKRAAYIDGLRLGECIFLSTDRGLMEARECVEKKIGGQVLCRVF